MNLIIGSIIVVVAVLGGFAAHGGQLLAIWQPYEIVIICGAALGAVVASTSPRGEGNETRERRDSVT